MRKTVNSVTIAGRLYEVKLEKRKVQNVESKNYGAEYITGSISIATDEDGTSVIPVFYRYVSPTFNNGEVNRTYGVLESFIGTDKTWLGSGKEEALFVQATPSLALNEWYDKQGQLVSVLRCENGFARTISSLPQEKDRNKFRVDMLINGISKVFAGDQPGVEEDILKVNGAIFTYSNALMPVTFNLRNPAGIEYVESLSLPVFTEIFGKINNTTIKKETVQNTAFGDPIVTVTTSNSREFLIENMNETPYEMETEDLTSDEVRKMIADREVHLADIKQRAENAKAAKNTVQEQPKTNPVADAVSFGDFDF